MPDNTHQRDHNDAVRRVAFVYEGVTYGGIEEYVLLLLRYLNTERYTPLVVTSGFNYRFCPELFLERVRSLGVPLLSPPKPKNTRSLSFLSDVRGLQQIFAETRTNVVHIHNSRPDGGRRATLAARLAGVPVVLRSEHLPPSSNLKPFLRSTVKLFDRLTDRIIAGSLSCRKEQLDLLARDPRKVVCAYYGIALERFTPDHDVGAAKQRLGLDPTLPVVGTVGRLSSEKGHAYFIDAAARVIRQFGAVNFLLVGDGPLEADLRHQVQRLGISDRFHFAGFQTDTVPYISAMDIAVMSSVSEGISLAMLEFMAMGKPVVTTGEPSFAETVVDGESGIVVALESSDALAEGIVRVLRDPALAARLGQAAWERVHSRFGIRANAMYLMDLYDALLDAKNAGAPERLAL